jgi:RNA polymerase sigma-70 factor (ECF subfamily)
MDDEQTKGTPEKEPIEEVFRQCESPLLAYAMKMVQDWEQAQEIVQEAFVRLHASYNAVGLPRPWLYRTVFNLAMTHHRERKKVLPVGFSPEETPGADKLPTPAPDERMVRMEAVAQTRACVEELDDRSQQLVRLRFEDGLSYKEMSERTGLTVTNVGYILHKSLKKLAALLKRSGYIHE